MKWYDYRQVYGGAASGKTPPGAAGLPGTLKVAPGVASPQLGNRRDVMVWLPPGYDGSRRLPVLYMQDGQNLFDPSTSFAGHWGVAETMAQLAELGMPAIAVGIPNAGRRRILEYSPFVDRYYGGGLGDHYLRFLADTVKPLVDASFATRAEPEATGLVGASLGGILALYGVARRPDVFGLCAALSPSCWFARQALNRHLTGVKRAEGRFYLDVGLLEGRRRRPPAGGKPLGATRFTGAVDRVAKKLSKKGVAAGRDLLYLVDPRGEHNEYHWRRRLPLALRFLLAT
jgi:predicted alpha/beta superfamily hydrolase